MPPSPSRPLPDLEPLLAHSHYIRGLARELVFDASLARDVEQETWLAALEHAPRDPAAQRGWLAAIVRNLARKTWRTSARRRLREEAHAERTPAVPTPAEVLEREDQRRALVERVNALEEPYRSALVLRYLEGCEPREVALRLGVPLETARTRLKRGLESLRASLDRANRGDRGAWCLLLVNGFELGPPGVLKLATLSLSSLTTGTSGILLMSLAKKVALTSVLLAAGGALFLFERSMGSGQGSDARSPESSAVLEPTPADAHEPAHPSAAAVAVVPVRDERSAVATPVPADAAPADEDLVSVSGRVLDPDGRPLANAEVVLARWHWDERYPRDPLATTRTDAQGAFALSYKKSDPRFLVDVERTDMWRHVTVSVFSGSFGPGWQDLSRWPQGEEVVLRLVHDAPLRGRLVDLEGQPVAGIEVRVLHVQAPETGDLAPLLANPKPGAVPMQYLQLSPAHELVAKTGADGRFELRGIGRERKVHLDLRGSTITQTYLDVMTRASAPIVLSDAGYGTQMEAEKPVLLGNDFEWVVRPTRSIHGTVRDAETGEPLAGVAIMSQIMSGVAFMTDAVRATTDAQGRFELLGMPKGGGNEILAVPNDEQPYFMRETAVPDPAGMEPVTIELALHRGVWITGRVTDRVTRKPVNGHLHYFPFLDNPWAQKVLAKGGVPTLDGAMTEQRRYVTDAEGRFRLVGLPGRAIVGVSAIGPYRHGAGAEGIEGANEDGEFPTFGNPLPASKDFPAAMRFLDIAPGADAVTCDLELDPGDALLLTLLDPEGRPLEHCSVRGSAGRSSYGDVLDGGPEVRVTQLGPDEKRVLRIHQAARDLGLATLVSLADGEAKRVLTLEPCATIVGRLVDQRNAPIGGVEIQMYTLLDYDQLPSATTDADGRFHFEHVQGGIPFHLGAYSPLLRDDYRVFPEDCKVTPGRTLELGDVRAELK